jgi:hypothetical protein
MMEKSWKIKQLVTLLFFCVGLFGQIKNGRLFLLKTLIMPMFKEIEEGRVGKRPFLQRFETVIGS